MRERAATPLRSCLLSAAVAVCHPIVFFCSRHCVFSFTFHSSRSPRCNGCVLPNVLVPRRIGRSHHTLDFCAEHRERSGDRDRRACCRGVCAPCAVVSPRAWVAGVACTTPLRAACATHRSFRQIPSRGPARPRARSAVSPVKYVFPDARSHNGRCNQPVTRSL